MPPSQTGHDQIVHETAAASEEPHTQATARRLTADSSNLSFKRSCSRAALCSVDVIRGGERAIVIASAVEPFLDAFQNTHNLLRFALAATAARGGLRDRTACN